MGEIQIETQCSNCETEFDESSDTENCIFCSKEFCDDCKQEHAMQIVFESDSDEFAIYYENLNAKIIKTERDRVRNLKKR